MAKKQIEAVVWVGCDDARWRECLSKAIKSTLSDGTGGLGELTNDLPKLNLEVRSSELKSHSMLDVMKDVMPGIVPTHITAKKLMDAPVGDTGATIGDCVEAAIDNGNIPAAYADDDRYEQAEDPQDQFIQDLLSETVTKLRGEL